MKPLLPRGILPGREAHALAKRARETTISFATNALQRTKTPAIVKMTLT